MRLFTQLFMQLDATRSTRRRHQALLEYYRAAAPEDAAWATYFLCGNKLKRLVPGSALREWIADISQTPLWLLEESWQHVGDLAETIALLLPPPDPAQQLDIGLAELVEQRLQPLVSQPLEQRQATITTLWQGFGQESRFLLNKMLTGGFRVGVSRTTVVKALAELAAVEPAEMAHRVMGQWRPSAAWFKALLNSDGDDFSAGKPYPFYLASPLEQAVMELGPAEHWLAEWKWDGIRAQVIRRNGECHLWSRGEELLNGRFPEVEQQMAQWPDGTVLDGELLAWDGDRPLPFLQLQRRIQRQRPGPKLLDEVPVRFVAYDLLEHRGQDQRAQVLARRRAMLEQLAASMEDGLHLSPALSGDWRQLAVLREGARERGVEGLMLKRRDGPYRAGRPRGDWWKWKLDPLTVDAVLLYAQPGHGRRANLLTDYTFAVWQEDQLVPVAKAYSGLTDQEIQRLDRWIRRHTKERFGPVRSVQPEQVFELAFASIQASKRHRSGVALRFPRIQRWRTDLKAADADQLGDLQRLLDISA
ncbi:MAG: ATP-dependent DNA ligase [Wenzhouxiangellaceae bacterium]